MTAIKVTNLVKEYRLGQLTSARQTLHNTFRKWRGQLPVTRERFLALDDINFGIEEGEVVGIIGANGAGKSTLLKHLADITKPTSGTVEVNGNVAPLIEVGAGLNPELTGRENIYLNSAILGVPKRVIRNKINGIIEFSELEQFIDTPIKRYSSGMTVRLGFAIATSLDADILIVDEVLAVGDLSFQRKCFDRMETLIKNSGNTVLLVSHNVRQVERICTRVILLDKGKVLADGKPSEVCTLYYERSNKKIRETHKANVDRQARVMTSDDATLVSIEILDENLSPIEEVASRDPLRVRVRFELKKRLEKPELVVGTHTTDFVYLTASSTATFDQRADLEAGLHTAIYRVDQFPLVEGSYCIRFGIFDAQRQIVFYGETLKMFTVTEPHGRSHDSGWWTLNLPTHWDIDGTGYEAPLFSLG